jgi:hypothetical protein
MFLRVFWVSEITTGDGRYVNWYAAKGLPNPTPSNPWKWPKEMLPNKSDWESWKKGLQKLGLQTRGGQIALHQPVGAWIQAVDCVWFYDPTCNRLLNRITGQIYTHRGGRPTRHAKSCFTLANVDNADFPMDRGVTVIQRNNYIQVESGAGIESSAVLEYTDFQQFLRSQPQWLWWAGQIQVDNTALGTITEDLRRGSAIVVSDGSYKDQKGTAAIVIEGRKSGLRIASVVRVPGDRDVQCTYRSEAAGILAAVQMVEAMATYANVDKGGGV